ncbi:MAG: acyl-CoA dehydrogenase, partial [Hydrogenophaga sp.]|uniref:acyl-CoA dehydrogenase n=1 Tax=Hydrogenophaga sp. TaxID=1904254 RepID=UPI00261E9527
AAYDAAHHHPDADVRKQNATFYEFLVPLVKGYSTEMSLEITSLGVQVHGGMGFIEETGAAQYYRDAKILTIYEGTTAIQSNDLVGRKTVRDGGTSAKAIAAQIEKTEAELMAQGGANARAVARRLKAAREAFNDVVDFMVAYARANPNAAFAGSVPYLMLAGNLMAGWQLGRALLVAEELSAKGQDVPFMQAKITTARFYADHILSRAPGVRDAIVDGADAVTALPAEAF